ncbi:MAG: hypothetical protein OXI63_26395 [Candidatus Poribacteria bacterium]|nr:hypothetical protein [Candidatus Poribacteria bacterium]
MLQINGRFKTISTPALFLTTLLMSIGLTLTPHADIDRGLFCAETLRDPGSLAVKLQDRRAAVSVSIAKRLPINTQQLLAEYDGRSSPSSELQETLLADLNRLIQVESLYDAQVFADIQLSEQTQALISRKPQSREALVRLNRHLLADAYPYELASPSEKQTPRHSEGIALCRENLRRIKLALDSYRASTDTDPQWLSDLSPHYLEKNVLLCPADATAGTPGVLTDGGADPTHPCSYLYEMRPAQKTDHELLRTLEGEMTPIVRCEHHRLNLSISGKLYRNGPQRGIYTSNKTEISLLTDCRKDLQMQLGEDFLKTQESRQKLKREAEKLIIKQLVPKIISHSEKEVYSQLEAQLGKGLLKTPIGKGVFKQVITQVKEKLNEKLQLQLQAQLGAEFFETQEGKDVLQQLSVLMSP